MYDLMVLTATKTSCSAALIQELAPWFGHHILMHVICRLCSTSLSTQYVCRVAARFVADICEIFVNLLFDSNGQQSLSIMDYTHYLQLHTILNCS